MERYVLVFRVKAIDYDDIYNSIVKDIVGSPKIITTFEHSITINQKPTKDLINNIIKSFTEVKINKLEIVSYEYIRTEVLLEN